MKNNVKSEKSIRKWLPVCLLIVLMIGGGIQWFQKDTEDDPQVELHVITEDDPQAELHVITEEPVETLAAEQFVLEADGLKINTQYASLHYPNEYVNDVIINVSEEAEKSVVSVFVMFDGMNDELFSIIFDTSESEGFNIGSLKREGKEVGIYIRMLEWNTENWPEENVMHLCRLQESVNILIDQLHNTDGFMTP